MTRVLPHIDVDRTVILEVVRRYGLVILFGLFLAALMVISPTFRSVPNLVNLLQQNAIFGIVACGMLLMIIVGGFDLSVGSVAALSGVVAAYMFVNVPTLGIPIGFTTGLAAGLFVGLINGFLIAKIGINPFIATLGMQILVRGLMFIATNARPIYGLPPEYTFVGLGRVGPVPVATAIFVVILLATFFVLRFTQFGHYVYAVGGDPEAARLNGINVGRVTMTAYAIGGTLAALGGLVLLGQTNIGQPAAAEMWPLFIIAIVVLGGTPLTGGVGGISAVLLGTFILGTISNALNLFNASPYWQPAITGAILIASVGLERYGARLKHGKRR
jgi:ribose/xylose/arabinose/galactoside ABC-type transport system permease subunit